MATRYKAFIAPGKKRAIRQMIQYQVILEDICEIFGATEEQKEIIRGIIDGKQLPSEPKGGTNA